METIFELKSLDASYDYLAPDKSEIRVLTTLESGGLCHCTLPVGRTSQAVKHKTVNEVWYCISGKGAIWQSNESGSMVKDFCTGDSFKIPLGNAFQFRNTGDDSLQIIIATMPKWPGSDEATDAEGFWQDMSENSYSNESY